MLNKRIFLLGFALHLMSCTQPSDKGNVKEIIDSPNKVIMNKVIYGDDDRRDLYQVTDPQLLKLADSTVALIDQNDLYDNSNGTFDIIGRKFGKTNNLCKTEPFREQETAAFCSGSLVGKNKIITAGHCIETEEDCANVRFVFGFAIKSSGVFPLTLQNSEIYSCKKIVKQIKEAEGADFAVIELDRDVVGHDPLVVSQRGPLQPQDSLVVIGHPSGLPTKIAGGGSVRAVEPTHYVTNLDTYGGNSGSAVFNSNTGEIEGILVRGENDFVYKGGCYQSQRCDLDGCRGEDVTRIDLVLPFLDLKL